MILQNYCWQVRCKKPCHSLVFLLFLKSAICSHFLHLGPYGTIWERNSVQSAFLLGPWNYQRFAEAIQHVPRLFFPKSWAPKMLEAPHARAGRSRCSLAVSSYFFLGHAVVQELRSTMAFCGPQISSKHLT